MYSNILKRELHFDDSGHERLNVFRLSYRLAMEIFEMSKRFPKEEMYSLTDQVRRSSRSVSANIGEGYRKRLYPKSFISKMIDVDGEATETAIHIRFAHDCGYISEKDYSYFKAEYFLVGKMINGMIQHPEKFTSGATATATATATSTPTSTEIKTKESK